jgi:hypothetical protein
MHFLLLICGKFSRAQLAHQIFFTILLKIQICIKKILITPLDGVSAEFPFRKIKRRSSWFLATILMFSQAIYFFQKSDIWIVPPSFFHKKFCLALRNVEEFFEKSLFQAT